MPEVGPPTLGDGRREVDERSRVGGHMVVLLTPLRGGVETVTTVDDEVVLCVVGSGHDVVVHPPGRGHTSRSESWISRLTREDDYGDP